MSRRISLLALVLLASLCACDDGRGVSTLAPSLSAAPSEIVVDPLWAGSSASHVITVSNTGTAPLSGLLASITDASGAADVSAILHGDALAPGGTLALEVTARAAPGASGASFATVVVDAGADGAVSLEVRANVRVPPSCDDGNPCTSDRFLPDLGACAHEVREEGSACDDGSACTSGDACLAGRCVGEALTCADDVPCTLDVCDPAVGCVFEPMHVRCDDEDPCTDDVCAPAQGCENPPLEEGALCHFAGCAEIGLCFSGQCVISEVPDGMPCEDGDACTVNDTCQAGECSSGPELGVGAAPPLVVTPSPVVVDLCRGPGAGADCYSVVVDEPGLERVLAADRSADQLRLAWQGGYVDNWGGRCDPTDLMFEPYNIDPPEEPPHDAGPAGGARERPANTICAAGVYLTTLDLGSALSSPSTTQLTAVRGPAAAAFPPAASTASAAAVIPEDPEAPPLAPQPAVVIVHPDFLRSSVWVEERGEDGALMTTALRSAAWSTLSAIGGLAVAADEQRTVVVAHVGEVELPSALCEAEGCELIQVPLWVFGEPRLGGDGGFDRVLMLPRTIDDECTGVTAGSLPFDVHDLSVFAGGALPRVSLRMSQSLCGDVAPGTLGSPPSAEWPRSSAAWWFEVDPASSNIVPDVIPPLEGFTAGGERLVSFRTTESGAASALRHVPVPCDCEPCGAGEAPDPEPTGCDCPAVEGTCFDTVIERALDVVGGAPEALLMAEGASLQGQTVPLVVEDELRVATLLGEHMELLGTGVGGALSRIVAQAPSGPYQWDRAAPLLPGPPESMVIVGSGISALEPVWPPPRQALVQVFGCGLGEAVIDDDACLEDIDCDDGLACDRSVCLPGPDCASGGPCDVCWGRCAEALAPLEGDGGVADDDGGASDEAGGVSDEDGGVLQANSGPYDGGE